jgi:hypothetical protein
MISNHVKQRIKSGKACFELMASVGGGMSNDQRFLVQAAKTARDAVETDA